MSTSSSRETDGNLVYTIGLLAGGLFLGFGIMLLPFSFGWRETGRNCFNCDFQGIGNTALDNVGILSTPAADWSIGMVVLGFLTLVAINAGAWRRTGGY